MPNPKTFRGNFVGGELSPEMYGRIEDAKFQSGASSIENLVCTPLGPLEKRAGFQFVATTKNNGPARLIPFTYSTTQTMVIEVGAEYFRFHTQGETLQYATGQPAFIPSVEATCTVANPSVFTAANHGYANGQSVVLAITGIAPFGSHVSYPTGLRYGPYNVQVIDANTFNLIDAAGNPVAVTAAAPDGGLAVQPNYALGALVSFNNATYYRSVVPPASIPVPSSGIDTNPAADGYWYSLPADLTYEIPNTYAAADLMNLHFVQSADVLTLAHPNYPPSELRRLGATEWTFGPITFGPTLAAPTNLQVRATLGYSATIASFGAAVTTNNPTAAGSLVTTVAPHTLAMGSGVYIKNLNNGTTQFDGFYMVSLVPSDANGNLIPNQLYLMDYSGNPFFFTGEYAGGATMQYGSQIVDITRQYAVAAITSDGIQQSALSAPVTVLNNLYVTGSYNTLTWDAVDGAAFYYVYKMENGLYGYIGQTPAGTLTFSDTNIAPDMSITPDSIDAVFGGEDDYPGAVSYYQQRRCFGGTNNQPQNFWATKTGTESDMTYSLPVQDTDRIAIAIATREMSTILHIVPLLQLILLTSSCEISASPTTQDTMTPSSICARPQSYIGANNVAPAVVNNCMVFCAARGGHVREMGYQWQIGGYVTGDISLRAAHLFDGFEIVDSAFMKAPWQVVWFVSTSGQLLGLTYIPEEQVGAWHHHVTDGTFQSIACVAEGPEDHLYAIITRQINGQTVNCIERMNSRLYGADQNAFYVDCGATFNGTNTTATTITINTSPVWTALPGLEPAANAEADVNGTEVIISERPIFALPFTNADVLYVSSSAPIFDPTDGGSVLVITGEDGETLYRLTVQVYTSSSLVQCVIDKTLEADLQGAPTANWAWARPTITRLTWLVGETVNVLVDGAVQPQCVVQPDGSITLQRAGVVVQVGLPYTAELDTLPITLQVDAAGMGSPKNVNQVWLKLYKSGGVSAGPTGGPLTEYKQRTTETYGAPPALMTKEIQLSIPPSWQPDGTLTISQSTPLPLTIVGITAEVVVGG